MKFWSVYIKPGDQRGGLRGWWVRRYSHQRHDHQPPSLPPFHYATMTPTNPLSPTSKGILCTCLPTSGSGLTGYYCYRRWSLTGGRHRWVGASQGPPGHQVWAGHSHITNSSPTLLHTHTHTDSNLFSSYFFLNYLFSFFVEASLALLWYDNMLCNE